ncbi:(R)-mandelonitrile lyase [Pseudomonas matsuisoli]|uniref:Cupin n=1 Tax=Pseudomonas matsuisoli TaxID=1515666 RepID=A0A917Q1V3_9PSED|nr:cupin domain-containing protein [Pseudomonas matsuisoli]GGK06419.1 cupin [Pseudomonas matsuisoli]
MKKLIASAVLSGLASSACAENINIIPNGSTAAVIGAPDNFTGHAVITPMAAVSEETRASTGLVTFAPGARTVWHTHPIGQLLVVTAGRGWVQEDGVERREINSGDVVWIPADVKHWHGATDKTGMSHIAITYLKDESAVTWQEPVADADYLPS